MRVAVSGASGLVGSALARQLERQGTHVSRLVRNTAQPDGTDNIVWQPDTGQIDGAALENVQAVVHLAGENIADGRWTARKKKRIHDSRVQGTTVLCEALARLDAKPHTLICAGAVGYYGCRDDEILDESSEPGTGFLAKVCRAWEQAAAPAVEAGIRVVNLRIGLVLSAHGGALKKMLPLFRLGLGGPVGDGKAWISWIHLEDLLEIIVYCMNDKNLAGPVNAVAPQPLMNRQFARTLGKTLHRPALIPAPAWALKAVFGEMARETLLSSVRVLPRRLEDAGFVWRFPDIASALQACIE